MQHDSNNAKRGCAFGRLVGRFFAFIGTTVLALLMVAVGFCWVLCKGPSPTARDTFVNKLLKHHALQFIPSLFLSNEEIDTIVNGGIPVETDENEEVIL